jgi:hypothetical protein
MSLHLGRELLAIDVNLRCGRSDDSVRKENGVVGDTISGQHIDDHGQKGEGHSYSLPRKLNSQAISSSMAIVSC